MRGTIVALLRDASGPVPLPGIEGVESEQFSRALASLLADGLVTERADGTYEL